MPRAPDLRNRWLQKANVTRKLTVCASKPHKNFGVCADSNFHDHKQTHDSLLITDKTNQITLCKTVAQIFWNFLKTGCTCTQNITCLLTSLSTPTYGTLIHICHTIFLSLSPSKARFRCADIMTHLISFEAPQQFPEHYVSWQHAHASRCTFWLYLVTVAFGTLWPDFTTLRVRLLTAIRTTV